MLCETCGIQHRKGCPIGEIRGTWEIYTYSHKVGRSYYYWMRCVACGHVKCEYIGDTKTLCRWCHALNLLSTHSQDIELVSITLPTNIARYKVGLYCHTCHQFWMGRVASMRQGRGCPYCENCAGATRKTEQDYIHLAKERGFTWVGTTLPTGVSKKTLWKCSTGHVWSAPYNNIQQGKGCPYCAHQPEGYVYLIRGLGGKLNGKYKLGHSNNPDRRLSELVRNYDIDDLSLLCTISTQDRFVLERYLHEQYAQYHHPTHENGREWFTLPFADVLWLEELSHYTTVEVSEGILVASR